MKLKKPISTAPKKEAKKVLRGDNKESWTKVRDKFVNLQPLELNGSKSVIICDSVLRPYLSKVAKMEGIDYKTIGLPDGSMAVLRYTTTKGKK
jgi:hypothetical protein